ncbi:sensor histidine kinase [Bradyrhizobium sp. SRS-191]|uniref:sensor histidine kinase n=1 Tax=Bradyrhizobium sp. SRS-191 TaxID=2962606 RepID=UPI00211E943D|nr:sensor histidine kinase [Bradyrhizobium sp. SRS-191]
MPGIGTRLKSDLVQSHLAADLGDQADWDLVLRESHHRMKNTLTLLGASVRRDLMRVRPGEVSAAVDRFERRLVAFGKLYQVLSDDGDLPAVSVATFFEALCGAVSEAILEPAGIRCEAAIQDGMLPASQCHRLALMLTELITNAAKHAFPAKNDALIRVDVLQRDGCWFCTVADNGIGATGPLQGTGRRILDGLARSIQARMHGETGKNGTRVTIAIPALAG